VLCGNVSIKGDLDILGDTDINGNSRLVGDLQVMGNIIVLENGNLCSKKIITDEIEPKTPGADIIIDGNVAVLGNISADNIGLSVEDEGSEIASDVRTINFTGGRSDCN
jgi:predicted acyltransferase (DUF342 family)